MPPQREQRQEYHTPDRMRQLRRLALKNIYTQRSNSVESEGDGKKVDPAPGREEENEEEVANVILQFAAHETVNHQASMGHLERKFSN